MSNKVAGVRVRVGSLIDAVRDVEQLVRETNSGAHVHLCNTYTMYLASRSQELRQVLNEGNACNYPDGWPVALAQKRLDSQAQAFAVPGPELFSALLASSENLRHFFLGSSPNVLEQLTRQIARKYPRADIAGSLSPPYRQFGPDDYEDFVSAIGESGANIVWVGLGTPKQDLVCGELARRSALTFVAVGAAFDFESGVIRRAPRLVRSMRLEWAYRMLREPRRLWKRYVIGSVGFAWILFRSGLGSAHD